MVNETLEFMQAWREAQEKRFDRIDQRIEEVAESVRHVKQDMALMRTEMSTLHTAVNNVQSQMSLQRADDLLARNAYEQIDDLKRRLAIIEASQQPTAH